MKSETVYVYLMFTFALCNMTAMCFKCETSKYLSNSANNRSGLLQRTRRSGKSKKPEKKDLYSWVNIHDVRDKVTEFYIDEALVRTIGYYLAAYKYFEKDRRYTFSTDKFEERKFFKHFPIPRLRKLHPEAQRACEKSIYECIKEVYSKAKISGTLQNFKFADRKSKKDDRKSKKGIEIYEPFKSRLEMFRYKVTASYYMCWYTERKVFPLAIPGDADCFKDFKKVKEAGKTKIKDFRSKYGEIRKDKYSPFTCSYLWFCPDPCYGKGSKGSVTSFKAAKKDKLNPCSELKDPACFWERGKNRNFEDLTRNRFNYTCNCENERKNFYWSPVFSLCIDIDECYTGTHKCPEHKVCRNLVGSYECTCHRGYVETNGTCKRHTLFRASSSQILKKKEDEKATKPSKIWIFVDFVLGVSTGTIFHIDMGLMVIGVLLATLWENMCF